MKAKDIMTARVATIRPETRVAEIASLLLRRRISGVPVVEDHRVVGIVSEGDLLRRYEIGTDRKRNRDSWWMRVLGGDPAAAEYVKSHACRAADIMTQPPVCIAHDLPAARIAALFEKHRIKRVPVLVDDRLAGIVTRADLVRALAERSRAGRQARIQSDEAIRAQLLKELSSQPWWPAASSVTVTGGMVRYEGVYEKEDDRTASRIAAENIPGVRGVEDLRISAAELPTMG
jgi:CBS domain-containing protein